MQPKLRAVALAVVLAALSAFPASASATNNNTAACNQLAAGGGEAPAKGVPKSPVQTPVSSAEPGGQCEQTNTSTVNQSSTATGGNGECQGGKRRGQPRAVLHWDPFSDVAAEPDGAAPTRLGAKPYPSG